MAVVLAEPPVPSSQYLPANNGPSPNYGAPNGNGGGRKPNNQYGPPSTGYGAPNGGNGDGGYGDDVRTINIFFK